MTTADPALPGFPAIWLRDCCVCAECRDPGSGQRLRGITDLPADVTVTGTRAAGDAVEVTFGPDGHQGCYADLDGVASTVAVLWRARLAAT